MSELSRCYICSFDVALRGFGFGWQYAFDVKLRLQIDTPNPLRSTIDDSWVGNQSPIGNVGKTVYHYDGDYYVGYPTNMVVFPGNFDFVVRKRGEPEKVFSLERTFEDARYYFNCQADESDILGAFGAGVEPMIDGDIFSLACVKQTEAGWKNFQKTLTNRPFPIRECRGI
jgi:hypothetical protein